MGLFPKDRDLTRTLECLDLRVEASSMRQRVHEVHVRLDTFIVGKLKWRSRSSIQGLIKDGYVQVDGSTPEHPDGNGTLVVERRPGRRLRHGSTIRITVPPELRRASFADGGVSSELDVLYEDEAALALDKPAGMAVHPAGRHFADTLIERVHARFGGEQPVKGRSPRLCHRLDRETSGIVLVARDPLRFGGLALQFEKREVEKEYLAVVEGVPEGDRGSIRFPLGLSSTSSVGLKMTVRADGQAARTDWELVDGFGDLALVRCKLFTGRQHQIRVHLASVGHPIVGDKLYGPDEAIFQRNLDGELTSADRRRLRIPRQALHHARLVFRSPDTKERVTVESPLPSDLEDLLGAARAGHRAPEVAWDTAQPSVR